MEASVYYMRGNIFYRRISLLFCDGNLQPWAQKKDNEKIVEDSDIIVTTMQRYAKAVECENLFVCLRSINFNIKIFFFHS